MNCGLFVFHAIHSIRDSSAAALKVLIARVWSCRTRSLVTPITTPTWVNVSGSWPRIRPKLRRDDLPLPFAELAEDTLYLRFPLNLRRLLLVRVLMLVFGLGE